MTLNHTMYEDLNIQSLFKLKKVKVSFNKEAEWNTII